MITLNLLADSIGTGGIVGIIVGIVLVLVLVVCITSIRIVSQAEEYIVEFLGKYRHTWGAGIHFLIPFFERVSNKVVLKEQVLDSKPQPVITKDNVTINIDSVVYFYVFDSKSFTYGAVNPLNALDNLSATTLRNIIGTMTLDDTLTSRDIINGKMTAILDEATDKWGIKVTRCEVKNIILPKEIQSAMEKQMKAEREKREAVLLAEAHQESVIKRAEGDKKARILEAEGQRDAEIARAEGEAKALLLRKQSEAETLKILSESNPSPAVIELKRFEAMVELANGRASKIIIPTDMSEMIRKSVAFNEVTGIGDVTPSEKDIISKENDDFCCDKEAQENHLKELKSR
ncbi:MAG: SPFH/Band 7/PHB domain protein [Bacillales bacterium]|nr:SPFH/Band 7/PHB domain protein [Bacillales bacterium]